MAYNTMWYKRNVCMHTAKGVLLANATLSISAGNVTDRNNTSNITTNKNDTIGLLNDVDMLKEFIDVDLEQTIKIPPNTTKENDSQREVDALTLAAPESLAAGSAVSDPLAAAVAAAELLSQQSIFENTAGDDTKTSVEAKTLFSKEGYGGSHKKHKDDSHSDDHDKKHKGINTLAFLYQVLFYAVFKNIILHLNLLHAQRIICCLHCVGDQCVSYACWLVS
jgi:hypothetical protein